MKNLQYLLIAVILTACKNQDNKLVLDTNYTSEVDAFFNAKMEERQGDYLQLVALHKLDSGNNTFGKSQKNNIILDIDELPETIGTITMIDDSLRFSTFKNTEVRTNEDSIIATLPLKLDKYGSSQKLNYNKLRWQIITRSKQHYLRVWNKNNPAVEAFKGFQKFELNSDFIFDADFTYYKKEKSEIVKAEVDGKRSTSFIGKMTFMHNDKIHTLEVGNGGFTMIGDATTGETTYGGGRYMYIKLPDSNGEVNLDFNKLYNPPCAFSEFTTCLYPPRQNHMSFEILAGEKLALNDRTSQH